MEAPICLLFSPILDPLFKHPLLSSEGEKNGHFGVPKLFYISLQQNTEFSEQLFYSPTSSEDSPSGGPRFLIRNATLPKLPSRFPGSSAFGGCQ